MELSVRGRIKEGKELLELLELGVFKKPSYGLLRPLTLPLRPSRRHHRFTARTRVGLRHTHKETRQSQSSRGNVDDIKAITINEFCLPHSDTC